MIGSTRINLLDKSLMIFSNPFAKIVGKPIGQHFGIYLVACIEHVIDLQLDIKSLSPFLYINLITPSIIFLGGLSVGLFLSRPIVGGLPRSVET